MAKRVKSYKRSDGTKVKAHVRKGRATRNRKIGERMSRELDHIIRTTPKKRKTFDLSKSLKEIARVQRKANRARKTS